jgi:hypothetical protein
VATGHQAVALAKGKRRLVESTAYCKGFHQYCTDHTDTIKAKRARITDREWPTAGNERGREYVDALRARALRDSA